VCCRQKLPGLGFSSAPPGSTLRRIRLEGGGSPCAGTPGSLNPAGFVLKCELQQKEASVFCRQLECGTAVQWSRVHHRENSGSQEQKFVSCQGTESNIFQCKINVNFLEQCHHQAYTQVVCTGRDAMSQSILTLIFMSLYEERRSRFIPHRMGLGNGNFSGGGGCMILHFLSHRPSLVSSAIAPTTLSKVPNPAYAMG
jgi:hypothetical protein